MDNIFSWIKQNPITAMFVPAGVSTFNFISNLILALQDGKIDDSELHSLITAADGFQTIFLLVIMLALKARKN
jgi:hypothetical protein